MTTHQKPAIIYFTLLFVFAATLAINCEENDSFTKNYLGSRGVLEEFPRIGSGSSSIAYKVTWKNAPAKFEGDVVVKYNWKNSDSDFEKEAQLMTEVQNAYKTEKVIPELHGCFFRMAKRHSYEAKEYFLVMDYVKYAINPEHAPKTEEENQVKNANYYTFIKLPLSERLEIYAKLAERLHQLHAIGIAHQDFTDRNFLMDKISGDGNVFLIDFERSKKFTNNPKANSLDNAEENSLIDKNSRDFLVKNDIESLANTIFHLENSLDLETGKVIFPILSEHGVNIEANSMIEFMSKFKKGNWIAERKLDISDGECSFEKLFQEMTVGFDQSHPTGEKIAQDLRKLSISAKDKKLLQI